MFTTMLLIVFAYLLGSASSAIIVCKAMGLPDPRTQGSKNPGATNVLRMSDKKTAGLVLAGDFAKGLIAVWIAKFLGVYGFALALVGLAAILGHIFPIFFQFKGGKGVATAIGSICGLSLLLGVIFGIIWLGMAKVFKYSSLAALTAIAAMPIVALLIAPGYFLPLLAIASLLFWTHRENIERLRQGNESKIGDKTKKE